MKVYVSYPHFAAMIYEEICGSLTAVSLRGNPAARRCTATIKQMRRGVARALLLHLANNGTRPISPQLSAETSHTLNLSDGRLYEADSHCKSCQSFRRANIVLSYSKVWWAAEHEARRPQLSNHFALSLAPSLYFLVLAQKQRDI